MTAAACGALAAAAWYAVLRPDLAVRYPDTYVLPWRLALISILFAWSASAFLCLAFLRRLVPSRLVTGLRGTGILGGLVALSAAILSSPNVGGQDATVDLAFSVGQGLGTLLVAVIVGVLVPVLVAVPAGARQISRGTARKPPRSGSDE